MFSKALMATSLSETSTLVARCLKGLQRVGTREIFLVHAMNIRDVGSLYHGLVRLAVPKLEEQKKLLQGLGFTVDSAMPLGFPYLEINRIAAEKDVSLIVVHSTADSMLGDYFAGGVAHDVINRAEKPVLVLRARMVQAEGGERCELLCQELFDNVLFPTDFSDNAERAFTYLERIAETASPVVTLLHVQEKTRIEPYLKDRLDEFNRLDGARLERLRDRLLTKGAREVHHEIAYGSAPGQIIRKAKQGGFSLLVMGGQGRGFVEELFVGSTSHQVLRHAPVPVLLVPRQR